MKHLPFAHREFVLHDENKIPIYIGDKVTVKREGVEITTGDEVIYLEEETWTGTVVATRSSGVFVRTDDGGVIYPKFTQNAHAKWHWWLLKRVELAHNPGLFASNMIKRYAMENQIPARSTSDLSPFEKWLLLILWKKENTKD